MSSNRQYEATSLTGGDPKCSSSLHKSWQGMLTLESGCILFEGLRKILLQINIIIQPSILLNN